MVRVGGGGFFGWQPPTKTAARVNRIAKVASRMENWAEFIRTLVAFVAENKLRYGSRPSDAKTQEV